VLDVVKTDLDRFHRALEHLLELGRLEAGTSPLVTTTVDACEFVRHALENGGRPVRLLQASGHDSQLLVDVDKAQMHRALVNLFENADLHGGGLTSVRVEPADDGVLITVTDEGPGVPSDERERIFDRFVRGGSRGSLPGAGLGLSLVAETVRSHGGAVWCVPGPNGVGSAFVVRLPRPVHGTAGEA
jgi:signal transduction histidine kinase